jgi:hypothetical protein
MFTSRRLNALRTVLYALFGRAPSHAEMIIFYDRVYKREPA